MEEREISIKDMLYHICMKWRYILICMITAGILLDVLGYLSVKHELAQSEWTDEEIEALENSLTGEEIREVEHAVYLYQDYQKRYDNLKRYLDSSIRMRLNANCVPTLTLRYQIDTHFEVVYPSISSRDVTSEVINTLGSELQKDPVYEKLAQTWREPVEPYYLKELVSCSQTGELLIVTIYALTEEDCNAIAEAVNQVLTEAKPSVEKQFSDFDFQLLSKTYHEGTNATLFNEQSNLVNNLNNFLNSLRSVSSNMNSDQKDYFQAVLLEKQKEAVARGEISETIIKKANKERDSLFQPKWILVGLILGGFVACAWVGVRYVFSRKLHLAEETEECFDIPVLGKVTQNSKKLSGLDHFFTDLFKKDDRSFDHSESVNLICANLRVLARKNNLQSLFFSDNVMNTASAELEKELESALQNDGFRIKTGRSAIYDAESVGEMAGCDGTVLILGVDVSSFEEIQKEAELCRRNGVRIIGGIVLQ